MVALLYFRLLASLTFANQRVVVKMFSEHTDFVDANGLTLVFCFLSFLTLQTTFKRKTCLYARWYAPVLR